MRRDRPLALSGAAACVLIEVLRSVAAIGDGSVGSLSAALVGPDTAVLSWIQPASGADGYELRVMRGSALVFAQQFALDAATKAEPVLYYRLTGLRPATTYNVSVTAILAGQQGPATSVVFTTAPLGEVLLLTLFFFFKVEASTLRPHVCKDGLLVCRKSPMV
ncbi:hypothetical protein MTO96_003761 [Rhipicephalus appendiculatus]